MELISVIMSVYNEKEAWLIESIESILKQTYKNIEFIIILDNPNNKEAKKTIEYYKNKDSRVVFIQNETNLGLTKSLNKGLEFAKGKYIARMDADDVAVDIRLQYQIDYLKKNRDTGLVSGNIIYINEDNDIFDKSDYKNMKNHDFKKTIIDYDPFAHPTWMFKKSILQKLKNYRDINSAEDYDFICRALINSISCGIIEEPLLYYRVRSSSITESNKIRQIYETERIKKEYIKSILSKKDYLYELDYISFDKNKFLKFSKAMITINEAKDLQKQGNSIKATIKVIKSLCLYPERLILKINMFIFKKKYN
jgi:glycosyltransferase involved in cell wall biosynthesis